MFNSKPKIKTFYHNFIKLMYFYLKIKTISNTFTLKFKTVYNNLIKPTIHHNLIKLCISTLL
jgi:hypothetical protein